MSEQAWGRWGASDEIGAPNLIRPEQVRRAAALVRTGTVISLAQPLSARMAIPPHRPPLMHFMTRDGGDYAAGLRRPGGFQFAEDTLFMPVHTGTHIDALCHCWYDDKLYNGYSGNSIGSVRGAQHLGADKIPPIFTRGLLLDCVAALGEAPADGTSIGVDVLRRACDSAGSEPREGDAVLLRTGWLERQNSRNGADFDTEPGIDLEAATWLAEAGVAVIGADNFAVEAMPFPEGTVFPVHQRLIRDYGIPLLEGLVLKPLAESGARSFLFVAAPLPIVGATGSPLTPLAVL